MQSLFYASPHYPPPTPPPPYPIPPIAFPLYCREWAHSIHHLWALLVRQAVADVEVHPQRHSLLPRQHPIVVPGGRFRESYYWDTFWTIRWGRVRVGQGSPCLRVPGVSCPFVCVLFFFSFLVPFRGLFCPCCRRRRRRLSFCLFLYLCCVCVCLFSFYLFRFV